MFIVVKFTLVFVLFVQIAYAIREGQYRIEMNGSELRPRGYEENAGLILLPSKSFVWTVRPAAGGGYFIHQNNFFLAVGGAIHPQGHVIVSRGPQLWDINDGQEPLLFSISPKGHNQLVLAQSPIKVFPPIVTLLNKQGGDHQQEWHFVAA